MRRSNILKSEKAMKTTMSALAAVALVAATDVRAQETGSSNTVQLPGSKDAKVTLVYQHALPGMPGKSVKGVLVEYGPGGYSPSHTHAKSALIYATVIEGERSAVRSTTGQKEHTAPARTGRNCPETIISSVRTRARQSPPRFSRSLSLTIRTPCHDTRPKVRPLGLGYRAFRATCLPSSVIRFYSRRISMQKAKADNDVESLCSDCTLQE
jgi:hypothetical protein